MATITAAAGGGNWTDGGTWVGGSAPTAADDAVIDVTAGAITINSGAVCRSLDCNTYTGILTHTAGVTLTVGDGTAGAGNICVRLGAGMTYTLGNATTSAISIVTTSATQQTFTTNGKTVGNLTISNFNTNTNIVLGDALTSTGTISHRGGTFGTANYNISCLRFTNTGATAKTMNLGTSVISITDTAAANLIDLSGTNDTINATTAEFALTSVSTNERTFQLGGTSTLGTIRYTVAGSSGRLYIRGSNTMTNLIVSDSSGAKGLRFEAGTTQIISSASGWQVNGRASNLITIDTNTAGSAATISIASGTVSSDYISLKDSTATGGATFYAGSHSTNVSGNSGWSFTNPPGGNKNRTLMGVG